MRLTAENQDQNWNDKRMVWGNVEDTGCSINTCCCAALLMLCYVLLSLCTIYEMETS